LLVDAGIDAVEHAADQERPPLDLGALFPRQRLDIGEGQIGPGAGDVVEEFDPLHGPALPFSWSDRSIGSLPRRQASRESRTGDPHAPEPAAIATISRLPAGESGPNFRLACRVLTCRAPTFV